jgi:hypothetical protein
MIPGKVIPAATPEMYFQYGTGLQKCQHGGLILMLLSVYSCLLVFFASDGGDKWTDIGLCLLFAVLSYKMAGTTFPCLIKKKS